MRGIDKFKERFAGHDGEYVLIGGGACDLTDKFGFFYDIGFSLL